MPGSNGLSTLPGTLTSPDKALATAREIAHFCAENAGTLDHHDAFPAEEFRRLAEAGLLAAPLPRTGGGSVSGPSRRGWTAGCDS